MKRLLITTASALFLIHGSQAFAQANQPRIEAILVPNQGNPVRVWINEVGNDGFRYYNTPQTAMLSGFAFRDVRSIFFSDPPRFIQAMQQFRGRDYMAAMENFAKVAEEFHPVRTIKNNPASRAKFFEIECLRLLGEYQKMSEKMASLNKSTLARENELRQLELNLMWEAVGSQAWDRLESLVREHANTRMPGNQRAQIAYCTGLVHENKGEMAEAIVAYNEAIVVDGGASEVVARMAALAILNILDADPQVQTTRQAWGTDDLQPNTPGYTKLMEAGAMARLFEAFLGAGVALPDKFRPYLEYKAPDPES